MNKYTKPNQTNQKPETFITRVQVRGTSDGTVIYKSHKCIHNRSFNDGIMILASTQYLLLSKRSQPKLVLSEFAMDVTGLWEVRINLRPLKSISDSKQATKSGRNQIWHIPPSTFLRNGLSTKKQL
jgi:hypothetical protein